MFGLTTRGSIQDQAVTLEFERLYARLTEFLSQAFDVDGNLIVATPTGIVPVGAGMDWWTDTPPDKWILLDGTPKNRVVYKTLFELWGTTHGAGDGSTTFGIPDARGRFVLGKSASGTGSVLGEIGGDLDHTHSAGDHTHTVSGTTGSNGGHSHSASTSTNGAHAHSQGAHQHAIQSIASVAAGGDEAVRAAATNVDIFSDSGTGSAGDHSHSVSVDSVGDHTHSFSATTSGAGAGSTGDANPAYIVCNRIVYTGVSA